MFSYLQNVYIQETRKGDWEQNVCPRNIYLMQFASAYILISKRKVNNHNPRSQVNVYPRDETQFGEYTEKQILDQGVVQWNTPLSKNFGFLIIWVFM